MYTHACMCVHMYRCMCAHVNMYTFMCVPMCIPDDFMVCTCVLLEDHQPQEQVSCWETFWRKA